MCQSKWVNVNGVIYPNDDVEVSKYYQKQWERFNLNMNERTNINEAFNEKPEPEPKPEENMYTRLKNRKKVKSFHFEGKEYIEIGELSFEDAMKIKQSKC